MISKLVITAAAVAVPAAAMAQDPADRATSAQVASERGLPVNEAKPRPKLEIAPSEAVAPPHEVAGVFVGAVTLSGLQELAPRDFADIIADRIGKTLSPADLAALANAVSDRIRSRGLPLGFARIDAQRIANGILVVQVNEGIIDEIRVDGPTLDSVRQALAPLQNGRPARLSEIERRLLIAGDIDGVRITGSRFLREGERGVLLITVSHDRVAAYVNVSNQGTRTVGREQARIEVDINGVVASDDSLTLSYSRQRGRIG